MAQKLSPGAQLQPSMPPTPRYQCPYCNANTKRDILARDFFKHLYSKHPLDFWSENNKKSIQNSLTSSLQLDPPLNPVRLSVKGGDSLYLSPYNHILYKNFPTAQGSCTRLRSADKYTQSLRGVLELFSRPQDPQTPQSQNPNELLALRRILGALVRECQLEAEDGLNKDAQIAMLRKELLKHISESELEALEPEEAEEPKALDINTHPLTRDHVKYVKCISFNTLQEAKDIPYTPGLE